MSILVNIFSHGVPPLYFSFTTPGVTSDESSFKNPILVDIGGIKDKNNNNKIVSNYNGVIAGER